MENQVAYIVYVDKGDYDYLIQIEKFATLDKEKAQEWVSKYNRLVSKYLKFLEVQKDEPYGYIENEIWDQRHSDIVWDRPLASFVEIEFRA